MPNVPNNESAGISCFSTVPSILGPPATLLCSSPSDLVAIADSGSTSHFCTVSSHVVNKRPTTTPIGIRNPNGTIMYSTHEAELDIPSLPLATRHVHIVPALANTSLLSMGQLCDSGCTVTFDATSVSVCHYDRLLLTGKRDPATGLWHLSLVAAPLPPCSLVATTLACPVRYSFAASVASATPAELVAFAHAALFSPALSTLHGALARGYVSQFLGLTTKLLATHPPRSVAMIKGHLDQTRKNQRSTKLKSGTHSTPIPGPTADDPTDDTDTFPLSDRDNARTHHCFAAIVEPGATGQIHTNQTGKFVVASSTGNNYILVLYDYDSNSILVEPMKSRSGTCILHAFRNLHARLVAAGLRPQLHRLDNECSAALKTFLVDEGIDFQLVPPGMHRRNAAERTIRTFKNHFIAGLCSVDKHFPLHLWDKLLPQAELTLNLLRGSRINPNLSAHAQLHGAVDFNRTPLAPPRHPRPRPRQTRRPHHVVPTRRRRVVHRTCPRLIPVLHSMGVRLPGHPHI